MVFRFAKSSVLFLFSDITTFSATVETALIFNVIAAWVAVVKTVRKNLIKERINMTDISKGSENITFFEKPSLPGVL